MGCCLAKSWGFSLMPLLINNNKKPKNRNRQSFGENAAGRAAAEMWRDFYAMLIFTEKEMGPDKLAGMYG